MLRILSKIRTRGKPALAFVSIAAAASMVNIYDGLTFLGTRTADASDSRNFLGAGLSDGTHSFAATDTDTASNRSAASPSVNRTIFPSITSFSAVPNTLFDIGGDSYRVETAGKSHSLTNPDPQTLRFEIRPGDHAWFDSGSVDRAEVDGSPQLIPTGTPVNIDYQFMLEPGATNTASWFVTAELHNDDSSSGVPTSPPFAIGLAGERLQVVARYCPTGLDPSNHAGNLKMLTLWTDPNPIRRGQYYDIKIRASVSNANDGYLDVSVNGNEVVNYRGPLGYGAPTYWEVGLYRSANQSQTIAANFRNLMIKTGSTTP
jgi:hypothetical protein